MATTFADLTGNGVASRAFSFPSIKEADIKVEVDGVTYENRGITGASSGTTTFTITSYTTTGGGNVVFDSAPASPASIRIYRDTDVDSARATFTAGASIKAGELNNNVTQLLYAAQEEQNQTILGSDIKDGVITSAKIADGTIVAADIANGAISTNQLATNAVSTIKINDAAVTVDKFQNIASGEILCGNGSNRPHTVGMSGDGTFSNTGVFNLASASVDTAELANGAVNTNKLQDDAVTTDKLANSIVADIAANTAKNTNVTTNLTTSTSTTSVTVNSSDGTNATIGEATGSAAGVMSTAHHDKLDGIEAGATADQTDAQIRAAVDAASDSNVFTDAEKTKLTGIEAGATGDQTNAEIKTAYEANSDTNVFTDAEKTKLSGIETGATGDQTNAQIKTAYEANSDTNAFTDAEKTKLTGIETGATADQTASDISGLGFSTLTGSETLTNKTLTTPVINDFSGSAVVTSGTSTSDNKVYSAKRSDELYSTGASQAATSATAAANSATAAASSQTAAASSATAAASSATTATTQASTATTQAANALTHLNTFKGQYLGALSSNPVADSLGNALDQGDLYFNTTSENVRIYNGSSFQGISENSVDASKFATSGFAPLYTASAGSNSINLGGLAISGAVFSNENIPGTRSSLSKGSATYNLGGL